MHKKSRAPKSRKSIRDFYKKVVSIYCRENRNKFIVLVYRILFFYCVFSEETKYRKHKISQKSRKFMFTTFSTQDWFIDHLWVQIELHFQFTKQIKSKTNDLGCIQDWIMSQVRKFFKSDIIFRILWRHFQFSIAVL